MPHRLLFAVLAVLAGATSYHGLRVFMAVHRQRRNAVFGTTLRRAPAVNTVRALFQALDPIAPEAAFRQHARALSKAAPPPDPVSSRWTARRSSAASTIRSTRRRRTC